MRLLIVGTLRGQLTLATKLAMDKGATVTHADNAEIALRVLRSGRSADLLMVEVAIDIRDLITRMEAEHITVPVVACGMSTDARAAVAAIHAGRERIHPASAGPRADRRGSGRRRGRSSRLHLSRRRDGACGEARPAGRAERRLGADHRRIRHRQGGARALRARKSNRARAPFIAVNCAAMPEHLLESELFGHEKGSFTGAIARRIGKFEEATGGTLLLDEISEMDVRLQAKLLRAIQERVIDRVGGSKPVPVDIRIIATSNRNLAEAVKAGTFREDLLYRLNVVNLKMPPLRERPADMLELAEHFVKMYAGQWLPRAALDRGARAAHRQPLARQRARAGEHDAPRRADRAQRGDRAGIDHRTRWRAARRAARGPRGRARDLRGGGVTRALVGRTVADVERD